MCDGSKSFIERSQRPLRRSQQNIKCLDGVKVRRLCEVFDSEREITIEGQACLHSFCFTVLQSSHSNFKKIRLFVVVRKNEVAWWRTVHVYVDPLCNQTL